MGSSIGTTSKVDALRARSAVASAEVQVAHQTSAASLGERQVRLAIHAGADEKLAPGEGLDQATAAPGNLPALIATAVRQRPELRSFELNAEAAHALGDVARAAYVPSLSAFGDGLYANPNPRRFPPEQEWFPTWAVGAQLTWSPTDIFAASASAGDADARAAAFEAQRRAFRDGIEIEVVQAFNAATESDIAIQASDRELESALEAYRASRELYAAGHGTSTALFDAEQALALARFDHLNARIDARVSRVRLAYATGATAAGTERAP